jgi:hypothetical protein
MVKAAQIRKVIAIYVSDVAMSVHDDAVWRDKSDKFVLEFGKLAYNIHKGGTPEAFDLANRVEFLKADLICGCITKDQFVESLRSL